MVKCTLVQALRLCTGRTAHRGSTGIALLFHDHGIVFCTLTEIFLTLTEVFPCFFLSCKANVRVKLAKTGHSLHSSNLVVFLCCSVVYLRCSMYCLCVGVYCTTATG